MENEHSNSGGTPSVSPKMMKVIGWTLVILILCAGFLVGRVGSYPCGPSSKTVEAFVRSAIAVPLKAFQTDVGHFPTNEEGLQALMKSPPSVSDRWKGPYLDVPGEMPPLDPWKRAYLYRCPGSRSTVGYDIWSLGSDGVPSDDDIGNWKK